MIEPHHYADRLRRSADVVRARGLDAVLVGVGPELEWLSGYRAKPLERLTLLVVSARRDPAIIVPRLELSAAMEAPAMSAGTVEAVAWAETEDPFELVARLIGVPDTAVIRRVLISDGMRGAFVLKLQEVLPGASFDVASRVISPLRRVKSGDEVELLRAAASAADRVIAGIIAGPLVGRTEADVAVEVRERLIAEGHQTAEFAIVAAGPNTASPHHEPGGRSIAAGEPLLFDIGGRQDGYCSDITRTVWVAGADAQGPDATFVRIYELVREAAASAREAVRPGVTFEALDRVARDVISAAGHGEHFFHRLGHGIGLEVHEEPYLVEGNAEAVAVGETFSIEPGIYLEGRYGVRIEDQVACTADGADTLNAAPRELLVVAGI